jgi:DNA-binding Lrp family transcriptional regulator
MNLTEKKLLTLIQREFPLISFPFKKIGNKLNLKEKDVINIIKTLKEKNIIRQISGIFDSKSIGYKSTLIAMEIENRYLSKIVKFINSHPGVTHNYKRNGRINLWFTLSLSSNSKLGMQKTIKIFKEKCHPKTTLILPTLKLYKIGVKLDLTDEQKEEQIYSEKSRKKVKKLSDVEIKTIQTLQKDIPLVKTPYLKLSNLINIKEEILLSCAKKMKEEGKLRRMAAILNHREAGFKINIMAVWNVKEENTDKVADIMSSYKNITHCYKRPIYPNWNYSIFTMLHTKTKNEADKIIKEIADKTKIKDYLCLKTLQEFKKTRIKYFSKEEMEWERKFLNN